MTTLPQATTPAPAAAFQQALQQAIGRGRRGRPDRGREFGIGDVGDNGRIDEAVGDAELAHEAPPPGIGLRSVAERVGG